MATYLKTRGLDSIAIVDESSHLLSRASKVNQARVHMGYHYPRSLRTALSSKHNAAKFKDEYSEAVSQDLTAIYAVAKCQSKTSARYFESFSKRNGLKLETLGADVNGFANPSRIESVYSVEEGIFDYEKLRSIVQQKVTNAGIKVLLGRKVTSISRLGDDLWDVTVTTQGEPDQKFQSKYVFNCTYSNLNAIQSMVSSERVPLKHELAEIVLVKVPRKFENLAITVMDGPFFSLVPFPSRPGLHTLTHVRFTPRRWWLDPGDSSYDRDPTQHEQVSAFEFMRRDVSRYIQDLSTIEYVESMYEIKTVLATNEVDDGRPIFLAVPADAPNFFSVLGGKIDNIFDILDRLDEFPIKGSG